MYNLVIYKQYNKDLNNSMLKYLKRWAYIKYEPLLREVSKAIYKSNNPDSNIRVNMSCTDAINLDKALDNDLEYKLAKNKKLALRLQKKRFNTRIKKMTFLSYVSLKAELNEKFHLFFVTLTFKPEVLDNTNRLTRHTYISRYLKDNAFYYIANIDFGTKKEREHYHAIVLLTDSQFKALEPFKSHYNDPKYKKYGFSLFERVLIPELLFNDDIATFENIIFNLDNTSCKIATYMNKLTNHAYKDSTEMKLIYSRNKALMLHNFYYTLKSINAIKIGRELFGADLDII